MTDKQLPQVPAAQDAPLPGVLQFDAGKYREHVDNFDLTEDQKVELLRTLWSLMSAFVDLGFRADSVQHVLPALAQITSEIETVGVTMREDECRSAFNEAAYGRDREEHDDR